MKIFRMNRKAISPIFATLILIAIAVIAGVVVYAFTAGWLSGMTSSGGAGQEKIVIQSASADGTTVTLLCQETSGPTPSGLNVIVKDLNGNIKGQAAFDGSGLDWSSGALVTIDPSIELSAGQYTATLVTAAGGSFVSSGFTVS